MDDTLERIRRTQYTDKIRAESMLLDFVESTFGLRVATVELRPLAVSLNSFNGLCTLADGRRLFFKTHTEPDAVISEFYNADLLAQANYRVLRPVYSSVEVGKQLLIYDVIEDPTVFDVARHIEEGDSALESALVSAQIRCDEQLFDIYRATLRWQSAAEAARAPIHQLFSHRLTGERLRRGYAPTLAVALPGLDMTMDELRRLQWTINDRSYTETLDDLIAKSLRLLKPGQEGASVIGHGDAHNGNVFLRGDGSGLMYFDPAFGGRHDPLLDLVKPLFHNTFATWMYFPDTIASELTIQCEVGADRIDVKHDFEPHPLRWFFLESKMKRVLAPLLAELRHRGWLDPQWRSRLKAALFCCPLLTKILTDRSSYPPEITLLGLAYAVEMGAESGAKQSPIDRLLDEAAR